MNRSGPLHRIRILLCLCSALALGFPGPAWAAHDSGLRNRILLEAEIPNATGAVNSDLAFWGPGLCG